MTLEGVVSRYINDFLMYIYTIYGIVALPTILKPCIYVPKVNNKEVKPSVRDHVNSGLGY